MNMLLDRLRAKRQDVLEQLLELTERCEQEHRPFTAEEHGQYDVLIEHVEKLNARIEAEKGQSC